MSEGEEVKEVRVWRRVGEEEKREWVRRREEGEEERGEEFCFYLV